MAGISKTPNGKWRVQIRRRGIYASKTFFKKAVAERWARETEFQIDQGKSVTSRGVVTLRSFGDLVDVHIADMEEVGKPLRRSKDFSLRLLKNRLGRLPVREITRERLVQYGRGRALEGAGPATLGAEISYIKTMMTHAAAVHGLTASTEPVDLSRVALSRLGLVGKGTERNRRPTLDELQIIFTEFDNNPKLNIPMTRIVKFAIASAMRQSEITSIKWKDLDRRRRTVLVRNRKDPRNKDGNDQVVPLTDLSDYDAFELVLEQQSESSRPDDRIFPYNPRTVGTYFRRAREKREIEDLRFHDLRHEATSRFFEAGLTIERVALITGHKDWKMLRRYTHLAPDMVFQPRTNTLVSGS